MDMVGELERAGEVLSPAVRMAIVKLEARIRELEARLGMNSKNSSRPPSQDPPGTRRSEKKKEPSGKRAGAQPGHKSQERPLLLVERAKHVIPHRPSTCLHCGHHFASEEAVGEPERRQLVELPPIKAEVTEHQLFTLRCPCCQEVTKASAPADIGPGTTFGPRLTSFFATLTVRLRASRRGLQQVATDLLDITPPSVGTLQHLLKEMSEATLPAYQEVWTALKKSPVANVDETRWYRLLLCYWLWAGVTTDLSFYRITENRNQEERRNLLGPDYQGITGSDRAGAYSDLPPELRQLCWAHLIRDFTAWEERGGIEGRIGRWALAEARRLFSLWHSFERGEIDRAELVRRANPLKARFTRLLYRAYLLGDEKMARISLPLIKQLDALWSFLHHEGVEPTNNMAEQALRAAVIWRKISFGSKSERGLRMVERLLTVAETAKKQKRDLLDYLTQALTAYRTAQPPPPLLSRA